MKFNYLLNRVSIGLILLITLFALTSCVAKMMTPKKGITNKIFKQDGNDFTPINGYDFSKLDNGYGLYVFSYVMDGNRGNNITGFNHEKLTGIRVYEYKFNDDESDTKTEKKRFMAWGYTSYAYIIPMKRGLDTDICATFHKGKIVYGGQYYIEIDEGGARGGHMINPEDEYYQLFLDSYKNDLTGRPIDTVLTDCDIQFKEKALM